MRGAARSTEPYAEADAGEGGRRQAARRDRRGARRDRGGTRGGAEGGRGRGGSRRPTRAASRRSARPQALLDGRAQDARRASASEALAELRRRGARPRRRHRPAAARRDAARTIAPRRGSSASSEHLARPRRRGARRDRRRRGRRHGRCAWSPPSPLSAADAPRHGASGCATAFGDGVAVAFDVDPALIAGAELHFPDAILRFSWQSAARGDARRDREP